MSGNECGGRKKILLFGVNNIHSPRGEYSDILDKMNLE